MEQRSLIAKMVRRYRIRLHPDTRFNLTTPLFLEPHGVYIQLEKRETN